MDGLNGQAEKIIGRGTTTLDPISRPDSRNSERTLFNMSDTELDERKRNADVEKEGLIEPVVAQDVTKDKPIQDPYARVKMLMWMAINTLATVFIVSFNPDQWRQRSLQHYSTILPCWPLSLRSRNIRVYRLSIRTMLIHLLSKGLHKQSHLLRPILQPMSSRLRILPLLRHLRDPLHPLPPSTRHVYPPKDPRHEHDPPRYLHGP